METTKIEIFQKRTFGKKLEATFDFVRENAGVLFKYLTFLLLPLSLIAALGMPSFERGYTALLFAGMDDMEPAETDTFGMLMSMLLVSVMVILMSVVACSLIYALMRLYDEREERLRGITFKEIKPVLLHNIGRGLLLMLGFIVVFVLAMSIIVGLFALSNNIAVFVLSSIVIVVCILPLAYWQPSYMLEELSLWASLKKSLRLGFPTWGGIFGVMLVIGILVNIVSTVIILPFYIVSIISAILFSEGESYVWMDYLTYLTSVIMLFGSMLLSSITLIAIAYQYGHAVDKIDGVSMDRDIRDFDQMGDHNLDAPEAFTEFDRI